MKKLFKIIVAIIATAFMLPFVFITQMGPIDGMNQRVGVFSNLLARVWEWASPGKISSTMHKLLFWVPLISSIPCLAMAFIDPPNWYFLWFELLLVWPGSVLMTRLFDGPSSWPWNA